MNLCLQPRGEARRQKKGTIAECGRILRLGYTNLDTDHVVMASEADNRITYLARTNFRDDRRIFGIKRADRRAHLYVIGKTGTGKSTLMETMIRQDMDAGDG